MNDDPNSHGQGGFSVPSEDELRFTLEELIQKDSPRAYDTQGFPNLPEETVGACPDPGVWIELAVGEVPRDRMNLLLTHAALCPDCLAQLRKCHKLFSTDVAADEMPESDHYASASPEWRRKLAAALARTPHQRGSNRRFQLFLWSGVGLAAALALVFALLFWRRDHAPEALLAQAYSQDRFSDVRIPGAGFAPVTPRLHLRGSGGNREPEPLLAARAEIEKRLKESPADAHWFQLEAREAVLEERYDTAIDILDRLVAVGPMTSSLLLDDGTAHFLRGTTFESEDDRTRALDYLRRADELAPNDPVVLFNEAVIMEDRGQVANAVQTWNRYLQSEHDPQWRADGRRRLQSVEDKLKR